ncbi:endolytic transglycosylase MltG [Streptomyces nitrosporeus]|uniref:endolytic transglycosylase MltG n=1 Tax=Streptomyces nitrosporeus TaxID=28894 RepID=UPI00399FDC3E
MTEYGRGSGSEPWRPEDPLYGDQGWEGPQAAHGRGQDPYQAQQPYPQDPYAQQGYPQEPYAQQHQQDAYGQQDPYAQQHQQDPYAAAHDPYAQHPQQPQYGDGGWDTGGQPGAPYAPQPAYDPQSPYDPQPVYGHGQGAYGEQADHYGTPDAYPPPEPPNHRNQAQEPAPRQQHQDWDPEVPQEETHPFFTGEDAPGEDRDTRSRSRGDDRDDRDAPGDEDDHDDGPRDSRRGRGKGGKGKKKNRNGCACLVVSLVLVGGLGGVAYLGYSYYQSKFGEAPDYAGDGTGSVEVVIPDGALGNEIANILKTAGVVKSVGAFTSAQGKNPKGQFIQAGAYLLKKEMSAKSALEMMLDPKSQNGLMVAPGWRNAKIYGEIDKKLGLAEGATEEAAKANMDSLGLPDWAEEDPVIKDPLEGFLYPATYAVSKGTKPEDVLKKMVQRATAEYKKFDLEAAAEEHGLDSPWQVITVASLVQAEGLTHDDFRKMAEVVYNRLEPDNTVTNRKLEFDSAFNYLMKQSEIKITTKEIRSNDDPYNTYYHTGLTPGPISNPGADALKATLNPTSDGWMFFISLDGKKTDFTKTAAEHEKLNQKFKEIHGLD